ncbi:hypothetical protein KCTC52924_02130 [Arenibacter antarcticus]|uniref:Uncharacterized protein n=1 Tax=Arenibacter antarcticus TaxID=2040469 RepID=A0ABW5VCM7_9FLAO|nr:hypothetical protein [Arenibacter sp. H213]
MKKMASVLTLFFCCIAIGSCTNDENDEKIDILTPTDSTKTTQTAKALVFLR